MVVNLSTYRIEGEFDAGGCGTVLVGSHARSKQPVVMKMASKEVDRLLLATERRIYARLPKAPWMAQTHRRRRDDILSLAYMLVFLLRGGLPWYGTEERFDPDEALLLKLRITPSELCRGLPAEFQRLTEYALQMEFCDAPDYTELKRMFRNLLRQHSMQHDLHFDWNRFGC
ncbi:casein kinase I homolog hhp1-like [Anopheles arabiensis]|uniref:casein kinase I homolog hhp1-like n=1 Tax=Anopheles arabiensis TaxID=7173 RepID=UPI001AADF142|nr:casein kinase I homolog hhp1-like [Anopheles arabiensis]